MPDDKVSDEDRALFRQMMHDVKPIGHTLKFTEKNKPLPGKVPQRTIVTNTPNTNFSLSNYYPDEVKTDSILSYCKQSIPRKRLIELRNGHIRWEARLDLHGLRPDAARESLCNFIEQQTHLAHRCLLVIHGKGSRNGEAPILKNHVNHWLQQLPHVLAFHSAQPRDGGAGALYVLLQRQR